MQITLGRAWRYPLPEITRAGAIGTEWAQGLEVIARDPDPLDALADAVGLLAGVALAHATQRELQNE